MAVIPVNSVSGENLTALDWVKVTQTQINVKALPQQKKSTWGHYGWCIVVFVLFPPDGQRRRTWMARWWCNTDDLPSVSVGNQDAAQRKSTFVVVACEGEHVNVQPGTGTDVSQSHSFINTTKPTNLQAPEWCIYIYIYINIFFLFVWKLTPFTGNTKTYYSVFFP